MISHPLQRTCFSQYTVCPTYTHIPHIHVHISTLYTHPTSYTHIHTPHTHTPHTYMYMYTTHSSHIHTTHTHTCIPPTPHTYTLPILTPHITPLTHTPQTHPSHTLHKHTPYTYIRPILTPTQVGDWYICKLLPKDNCVKKHHLPLRCDHRRLENFRP